MGDACIEGGSLCRKRLYPHVRGDLLKLQTLDSAASSLPATRHPLRATCWSVRLVLRRTRTKTERMPLRNGPLLRLRVRSSASLDPDEKPRFDLMWAMTAVCRVTGGMGRSMPNERRRIICRPHGGRPGIR